MLCKAPPPCAAGGDVTLDGRCTAASGMDLIYTVNGTPATTASCPPRGGHVTVSVLARLRGQPACGYDDAGEFEVAGEARGRAGGRVGG